MKAGRPRTRKKPKQHPNLKQDLLTACLWGLASHSSTKTATAGQAAPSSIRVTHKGVEFMVQVVEHKAGHS